MKKESVVDKWKAYNEEPKEVEKDEKDEVYEKTVTKFKTISLPDEEIQSLFSEGILSTDINTIYNYVNRSERAKNAGVLFVIDIWNGPVLLFAEDYLIITCYSTNKIDGRTEYKQTKMMPVVVPYDRINEIGIKTNNRTGNIKPIQVTKSGNPVVGAAVGGVLAGPTGAIIGASATSKPKTQTVVPGYFYNDEIFYFYMYTDEEVISKEELFRISNVNNKVSDTYTSTWEMNAFLTGKYRFFEKCQPEYIFNLYSETILGIVENGKRICRQKKILDILSSEYDCSISCQDHASERQFYDAMCHEQKLMSIKGFSKLKDRVNSYEKEKEQALEEMRETITKLCKEHDKLKLWDRKQKEKLEKEIIQIRKFINELKEEFTDISDDLIKLLGC